MTAAPTLKDSEINQKLLEVQKPFLEKVSGRRRLINFMVEKSFFSFSSARKNHSNCFTVLDR